MNWFRVPQVALLSCASVNGAVREGGQECRTRHTWGALLEVRDLLPLANFRQHGNHCGKSYPSQCLCICMNQHKYALLKSGHLTYPHGLFIGTSAARDWREVVKCPVCCNNTWENVLYPFSWNIDPWARNTCASLSSLPALPATFLLSYSLSACEQSLQSWEALLWGKEQIISLALLSFIHLLSFSIWCSNCLG